MKDFEEIDVFVPDAPMHKAAFKKVYTTFAKMLEIISEQLKEKTYKNGLLMMDYCQLDVALLAKDYAVKLYFDEKECILYVVLCYANYDDKGEVIFEPICHVNVDPNHKSGLDCDSAAYVLSIAFIAHTGQTIEEAMNQSP